MTDYQQQAQDFLTKTGTQIKAELSGHGKYFDDDEQTRDIYTVTITRQNKKPFVFTFGQSVKNSGTLNSNYIASKDFIRSGKIFPIKSSDYERKRIAPTAYDILACLTKYEPGSFENFCSDYGYDTDSRRAEKIYIAVQKEYSEVMRMFRDVMGELSEIN